MLATTSASAGFVRDSETESLIRDYSRPIFRAAGLGTQGIQIHLVGERSFNAFVVDGQNMFINVGTLMNAKTPNQVIGVIAHESGHIAGGHLARLRQQVAKARTASLMLQVLGLAAMAAGAFAGGGGDVGVAGAGVAMGGGQAAFRSVLAYQRAEESSADQAAVVYLNATKQSARGMLKTFEFFADQGIASIKYVDPYAQTHPMPQQRMSQLHELAEKSPYFNAMDSPELQRRHDMMRAKLYGFLDNPKTVFNRYPASDNSSPARYARAVATYRMSGVKPFLPQIDGLIAEEPRNPYYLEIKGQFLFETGNAAGAIPPLRQSVQLAPEEPLIRIMLAQALLANQSGAGIDEAIGHLKTALAKEDDSATGYRQLANAYGKKNQIADAELASAQAYFYEGKLKLAKDQAFRAKGKLKSGSPGWVKADDILNFNPPQAK